MPEQNDRASKVSASWSTLYAARGKLLEKHRSVWDIPIRNKHTEVLLEELTPGASVLEIGGADRSLEPLLKAHLDGLQYKSMDVDRQTTHDYYELDHIHETFDAILLFEVIEHMSFGDALPVMGRIFELLKPGGVLLITTPNVAHPTHYYRDPTHVMPWSHEGLGGALVALGFDVTGMYRIYDAPIVRKLLRKYVASLVHRYLGIDFTHSLMVVARRPGGS